MLKLIPIKSLLLFLLIVSVEAFSQSNIDNEVKNWNQLTLKSINKQMKQASLDDLKSKYENRALALTEYWREDDGTETVRKKMMKSVFKIQNEIGKKYDFYIVEANESGVKVLLRTFVFWVDSTNSANVVFFDFFEDEWHKTGGFVLKNFVIQKDIGSYVSKFGTGYNHEDIITTKLKNGKVTTSDFFLFSTMSSNSPFKSILDGYRKENFTD